MSKEHTGPSPRGRGHPTAALDYIDCFRAIPAWAGAPAWGGRGSGKSQGHPRVGGGTHITGLHKRRNKGPSPRGRGHHPLGSIVNLLFRAIPAWAGAPNNLPDRNQDSRGHPRVGGGTRSRPQDREARRGAIPAWAGAPAKARNGASIPEGHPRVGGGTQGADEEEIELSGPSPRGRGHQLEEYNDRLSTRAIPAWAGAPTPDGFVLRVTEGHPRVGGGTSGEQQLDSIQLSKISRLFWQGPPRARRAALRQPPRAGAGAVQEPGSPGRPAPAHRAMS